MSVTLRVVKQDPVFGRMQVERGATMPLRLRGARLVDKRRCTVCHHEKRFTVGIFPRCRFTWLCMRRAFPGSVEGYDAVLKAWARPGGRYPTLAPRANGSQGVIQRHAYRG